MLKMERVDHVDIGKIDGSRFISQVDRMVQWQDSDREGLKFRIAGFQTSLVVVIHL